MAVIRMSAAQALMALVVLIAGCGGGQRVDRLTAVGLPAGFSVRAATPENLRVLSFTPQGSSLTCTALFGSDLTSLQWTSDLPPPADLAPIAIAVGEDEPADIYLVAPDGSWTRRLTGAGFRAGHPTWSPDGTRMAVSSASESADVWVMNAAGRNRCRVTDTDERTGAAAWRPTGGCLAFRHGTDRTFDILTAGLRGGPWRQLTDTPYFDRGPEWSPDGSRLVFASNRGGNFDIYTMDAAGQHVRRLTHDTDADVAPAWSPDGSRILFSSYRTGNGDLYVMDVDGSNLRRLTDEPGRDAHPDWSPDGQRICYRHETTPTESHLRVINADGSGRREVLGHPDYHVICTAWIVRRSKRVFIGRRGDDAGCDPPLANRAQAVILMHDDRSIRSVVGVRTAGATAVAIFRPATAGGALLRLRSATRLRVVEALWMGQPATCHLPYSARAVRCRIAFDLVAGRVAKLVPM